MNNIEILFEDNHIIAVNKKSSDIVQADKTGDLPLSDKVKNFLKEKYNKPGNVYLGTIHRIDRPVSGVVLFGKTSKATARLSDMFKTRAMEKEYWAIVKKEPPNQKDTLVSYLKKNTQQNKSYVSLKSQYGYLESVLEYELLLKSKTFYLLKVKPHTGRHHQIRAQLASIGCPIKGDVKYGFDRTNEDASIHLHARSISFLHPVSKVEIKIEAPTPNETLWNYFTNELKQHHESN